MGSASRVKLIVGLAIVVVAAIALAARFSSQSRKLREGARTSSSNPRASDAERWERIRREKPWAPKTEEALLLYTRANPRRPAEAIDLCTQALEIDPAFARAYCKRADARMHLPEADDPTRREAILRAALRDCASAIEHAPDYAPAWSRRGEIRLELEEVDAALDDFEKALALDEGDAAACAGMGRILLSHDRLDEALP